MKNFAFSSAVLIILSLSCCAPEKTLSNTVNERLDSLFQTTIGQSLTPGVAIAIVSSSEVLYNKAFGLKEIGKSAQLQVNDAFDFSSIVKTVMSTAMMQLVEQGEVNLDRSAGEYLPILSGELSQPTVKQMLSHSSGIQFSAQEAATDGSLNSADLILANPPGTKLQYSNAAFYTLGKLIAQQRGSSFPDYVTSQIFSPLGMTHSSVASFYEMQNLSAPHTIEDKGLEVITRPAVSERKIGNGFFYSTMEDMSIWAQMHLRKGKGEKAKILSADSYTELWKANLETGWDNMKAAAGLGWFIGTVNGRKTASHIGGTNGYSAALVIFPDDNRAIVIAGNSNKLPREALIEAIGKILFP